MRKSFLTLIACSVFAQSWALTAIVTKNVVGSPFCGGEAVNVLFQVDAPANPGNVFTAQLSDKTGSFASPTAIGTLAGTGSGSISATIPSGTATGTKYKVRVVASNPVVIGSPATKTLKINPKPTGLATSGITSCATTLTWAATATAGSYKVRYKLTSSSDWSASLDAGMNLSYAFTGLKPSSSYDFQVRSVCPSNGDKSDWAKTTSSTLACPTPTGLIVTDIGLTTTSLNWNDASCAGDYSFRYRLFGSTSWTYKHPVPSNINLTGLFPASLYEAQVATRCTPTDSGAFTASTIWETEYFRLSGDAELAAAFSVFPNPSNGEFTVKFNSTDEMTTVGISVQNIYGQVVHHVSINPVAGLNEERISLNGAAKGMYFITIKEGDKEFKQSLLLK